jgi:dihydroxyacid dehydratase/phosphogluconate dehydratase
MPEAGYLPIPKKLARGGVKDMVRISDARMSGTAFGTIVLHITPESAVGGRWRWCKNGDMIRLDVAKRSIDLLVDASELKSAARRCLRATPDWAGAATRICSTRPSCRPTKAAISISCAAAERGSYLEGRHARESGIKYSVTMR